MLETLAVLLFIGWLLGVIGTYSIGWFVHLLLVAAVIVVLIRIIRGQRPI